MPGYPEQRAMCLHDFCIRTWTSVLVHNITPWIYKETWRRLCVAVKEFGFPKGILLEKAGPWIKAHSALGSNNWCQWMPYQIAKNESHTLGKMLWSKLILRVQTELEPTHKPAPYLLRFLVCCSSVLRKGNYFGIDSNVDIQSSCPVQHGSH